MAVEPLYNSKTEVLNNLRMNDSSDEETLVIIDQSIADVRLGFYRRLTPARATEIAALTSAENPTTTDEILRANAESVEINWVLYLLVCKLPTMYIETQFPIQNSFDDTPITRDADNLKDFLRCLWNAIEQGLGQLIIPVDENTGAFQAVAPGRKTPFLLADNFIGLQGGCRT